MVVSLQIPLGVFCLVAALAGALVGSFLNVCIYRLPRGMSVRRPARSFCPECQQTIPWFHNIPVLSWLLLQGRCAACGRPIVVRYVLVELLTAVLFACAAWKVGAHQPWLLLPHATLIGLLIVATFVDFEHLIIPDEITWGGVAAGAVFAFLLPELHGAAGRLMSLGCALLGAGVGYGLLWAVVELGRLVFGRRKFEFASPVEARWTRTNDTAVLVVDGELLEWSELFPRGTENVVMEVVSGSVDGAPVGQGTACWSFEMLELSGRKLDLNATDQVRLQVSSVVLPREVMGFGDVKFLAAIGAFTGWKAVFFTVMAASTAGAIFGVVSLLLGKREWSTKIPFGPYLALGAALWLAAGRELWDAYWGLLLPS